MAAGRICVGRILPTPGPVAEGLKSKYYASERRGAGPRHVKHETCAENLHEQYRAVTTVA